MDVSDILIFILAAIGLAVSAVSKNAKRKAEETRRLTKPEVGDWNEDNNHIPDPEEVTHSWDEDYSPPAQETTHANKTWSYDHEAIKAQASKPRIDDMHRKSKRNKKEQRNIPDQPVDKPVSEASDEFSAQHFNLRDAIIYSELLKPKHEEY